MAGFVSGTANLAVSGVPAGGNVLLRLNSTGGAVDEIITVGGENLVIRFGDTERSVFAISVSDFSMNIANVVSLEGNVSFTNGVTLSNAQTASTFAGSDLSIFFGEGPATLANGDANPLARGFLLTGAKVALVKFAEGTFALDATGTVQVLGIAGLSLSGTVRARVNSSSFDDLNETLTIPGTQNDVFVTFGNGQNADLSGAPFATVEGIGLTLTINGQPLTGDVTFDKLTRDPNQTPSNPADDVHLIRLSTRNVSLGLGNGAAEFLTLRDGVGSVLISKTGVAGAVGGAVRVDLPGVALGGNFDFIFNTSPDAATESFVVGTGAGPRTLNGLPAGPYVRVSGQSATVNLLGQQLGGDFDFERISQPDGSHLTRLAAANVSLNLGDGTSSFLTLSHGSGSLLVTSDGLAGRLRAARWRSTLARSASR